MMNYLMPVVIKPYHFLQVVKFTGVLKFKAIDKTTYRVIYPALEQNAIQALFAPPNQLSEGTLLLLNLLLKHYSYTLFYIQS